MVVVHFDWGDGLQQVASFLDTSCKTGTVGVCAALSQVKIRNVTAISLEEHMQRLRWGEYNYSVEKSILESLRKRLASHASSAARAVKLIQDVARVKLHYVRQRMKLYRAAEEAGRDTKMRERKLLTWLALFSVLQKFDRRLKEPEIADVKEARFLRALPPPPPPPPPMAPPSKDDEELHYRYEEMKARYEPQWKNAGRMVLGEEKFDAIRSLENGPAEKEKLLISQKCLEKANHVMSEREHQEFIRKAWCLENDWESLDEVDPKQIERWAQNASAKYLEQKKAAAAKSSGGGADT